MSCSIKHTCLRNIQLLPKGNFAGVNAGRQLIMADMLIDSNLIEFLLKEL
jgi:hypothetical protein